MDDDAVRYEMVRFRLRQVVDRRITYIFQLVDAIFQSVDIGADFAIKAAELFYLETTWQEADGLLEENARAPDLCRLWICSMAYSLVPPLPSGSRATVCPATRRSW